MISNIALLIVVAAFYRVYSFSMFSSRKWFPLLKLTQHRAVSKSAGRLPVLGRPVVARYARNCAHVGYKAMLMKSVLLSQLCNVGSSTVRLMSTSPLPASTEHVVHTQPAIVKKALDNRDYKALTLANGMRALLVSDPASIRSAAALDVHVGYFSDPKSLPGLAHFCEHMSFLGTKKYPGEEEFSSFLSTNGGSSNAYTDAEDTVYVRVIQCNMTSPSFHPHLPSFHFSILMLTHNILSLHWSALVIFLKPRSSRNRQRHES